MQIVQLARRNSSPEKESSNVNPTTLAGRGTKRVFNFNAGPGALPVSVLERMREELLDYGGTGMSVMEMSHRSPEFEAISDNAESALRRVLSIPDDYAVTFLQGGGQPAIRDGADESVSGGKAGGRAAHRLLDRKGNRGAEENRTVPAGRFNRGRQIHARAAKRRNDVGAGRFLRGDVHE